jgi:hypothetical protein
VARRLLLLVIVLALALPAGASARDGDHPRELGTSSCNVVRLDGRTYVLYRQGVPCSWARRWIRLLADTHGHRKPGGFSCTSGAGFRGNAWCERGSEHFGWDSGA